MKCAKCNSRSLTALPASDFSRHPGWVCKSCGLKMRYTARTANYWMILSLGLMIATGLGGVFLLGAIENHYPGTFAQFRGVGSGVFTLAVLGIVVAAWAVGQLCKPAPIAER